MDPYSTPDDTLNRLKYFSINLTGCVLTSKQLENKSTVSDSRPIYCKMDESK